MKNVDEETLKTVALSSALLAITLLPHYTLQLPGPQSQQIFTPIPLPLQKLKLRMGTAQQAQEYCNQGG